MGPARARAEHLGHARPCRTDRARRAAHGSPEGHGIADRAAMTRRSSHRDRHHVREKAAPGAQQWRLWLVGGLLLICAAALIARALFLQFFNNPFLIGQADARILRDVTLSA